MSKKFLYTVIGFGAAAGMGLLLHTLGVGELALAGWFLGAGLASYGANRAHGEADAASLNAKVQDAK